MEYGRITLAELAKADTRLPADPAGNAAVLADGKGNTKFYMGTPKWGGKEWIGKLYPRGTKDARFLDEYVRHYNAVEMNSTHYRVFTAEEIFKWQHRAPGPHFKFCPKVWNQISHYGDFSNTGSSTSAFLGGIRAFAENLGPIFLQVSEKFSPGKMDRLLNYLQSLPGDLQFFVELRHPDWFAPAMTSFFDALRDLKIGLVITDTPAHREVLHMTLTVPKVFIRFSCQGDHPTDTSRTDEWVKRIQVWQEQGLEECYFFVHALNDALSPEVTRYVARQFNQVCKAGLPEINLLTLF